MIYVLQRSAVCVMLLWPILSRGQGTLTITFDGPPTLLPGSAAVVQQYYESGMRFQPLPGTDGFTRVWSGSPAGWPNDGTPYVLSGAVDTLAFGFTDGSLFGLASVNLAGFSSSLPDYTVNFVGYYPNGSTITTSFSGTGINFQTYTFDSAWSSGLTRVEIPNYGWSLDNLIVSVPEPGPGALFVLGALTLSIWRSRTRNSP